jgi:hypothetical protein
MVRVFVARVFRLFTQIFAVLHKMDIVTQAGNIPSEWKVAPTQIDELWDLPLLTGSDLPISSCLNAKANSSNLERRLVPHRQSAELLYHVDSPLLDAGERACIKLPFYLVLEDLCLAGPCVICLLVG